MQSVLLLSSLGFLLVAALSARSIVTMFPAESRDLDPPIEYGDNKWDANRVFSLEYPDAREKFRSMAKQKGATEIAALPVVEEKDYTIDIAIFPGTRPGAILHTSGTHGVEGYAGSAIQLALLDSLETISANDRPTLILVHALNPYGMAEYRRYNENNVDLNRNGIIGFADFLKNRDHNIAGYDDLKEFLSPPNEPSIWDTTLGFWTNLVFLVAQRGLPSVKRTLVSGQYHHPQGVFYGGAERQRSITQLVDFLESRNLWDELLVHIDVHTGLGKLGKDTLMFDTTEFVKDQNLGDVFTEAENIVTPEVEDKKAMAGYDLTQGLITGLINSKAKQCVTLMQEFGTIHETLVGRALVLENALYHHGTGENRQQGRQWMQQAFYPQSTEWRASVVQRGVAVVLQAIELSKSLQRS